MAFFRHHAEGKEVNLSQIIRPGQLAVEFFFHGISVIGMDHREEGAAGVFREVFIVVTFQKVHHHLVGEEDFSFFRSLHHQNAAGEMVRHIGKVEAELGPFVSNRNGAVKLAPAGLSIELGAVKGIVGANTEITVGIALFRIGSAAQGGIKFHFPLPGHEGMGSLGKIIHGSGNGAEVLVGAEKNEFIAAISGDDGFFAEGFPHIPDQRFQGFVAYAVSVHIVHQLEVIDIQSQHHRFLAGMGLHIVRHRLVAAFAVKHAGQRIPAATPLQVTIGLFQRPIFPEKEGNEGGQGKA